MTKPHHGAPRRPNIAVVPDLGATGGDGARAAARYELKVEYADAVLRAGGLPHVIPYSNDRSCVDAWLDRASGLLLTGGAFDVPPELYGEIPREGLGPLKPARTSFEVDMLRGALTRRMPVLAVCGGMQLLNAVLGGSLYQDLARELPTARLHQQPGDPHQPHHPVEVKEHTALAECVGRGQLMVNSTHHQALNRLASGLTVVATAPDGVIEAVEGVGEVLALGVQWHPEALLESVPVHVGIYRWLVARARERRHDRSLHG